MAAGLYLRSPSVPHAPAPCCCGIFHRVYHSLASLAVAQLPRRMGLAFGGVAASVGARSAVAQVVNPEAQTAPKQF